MQATHEAPPEDRAPPAVPRYERIAAGILTALFGASWAFMCVVSGESPIQILSMGFDYGVMTCNAILTKGIPRSVLGFYAFAWCFFGLLMGNILLGIQAILRALGYAGYLRGCAFWWWTIGHAALGLILTLLAFAIPFFDPSFSVSKADGSAFAVFFSFEFLVALHILLNRRVLNRLRSAEAEEGSVSA